MTARWLLLCSCLGLIACGPEPEIFVEVWTEQARAEVDERYLSFAVDSAQVFGGRFWNPTPGAADAEVDVVPYDFERERIRTLAAGLAPAMLRVGGTSADHVHVDLTDSPADTPPDPYQLQLTADDWDRITDFTDELDLDLFFTLNVGPGPRDEDGDWDDVEARALMEHATSRGDAMAMWELGNEINGFLLAHGTDLSPEQYADDMARLRALVDEVDPGTAIGGPSSAYWPVAGELVEFYDDFMPLGGEHMDVVTWHYYPQQSQRCPVQTVPAGPEVMLDPAALDEVLVWADEVESLRDRHAPHADIWLGETGNAQCGGEPGVSDTFAGSFWWLDQLGLLARRGHQVTVRQTLSGSDYGLIDEGTLEPNPDYWVSLLFKKLMGTRSLETWTEDTDLLRNYAHCAPEGVGEPGAVTVAVINLSPDPVHVGVDLPVPIETYILSAPSLQDRQISLGNRTLVLEDDGSLPAVEHLALTYFEPDFEMPGHSMAFVLSPKADAPVCLE
jgi:heparanase